MSGQSVGSRQFVESSWSLTEKSHGILIRGIVANSRGNSGVQLPGRPRSCSSVLGSREGFFPLPRSLPTIPTGDFSRIMEIKWVSLRG